MKERILAPGIFASAFLVCAPAESVAQDYEIRLPLQSEITPESRTEPIIDYSCKLYGVDGEGLEFAIRYTGTRGFLDPQSGEVNFTTATANFSGRDASHFGGYEISAYRSSGIRGYKASSDGIFGQAFELQFERTQFPGQATPPYREGVLLRKAGRLPHLLYALGYCEAVFTAQSPLSSAEIAELIEK